MFGVGLWEIVAIAVVALVLIRPRDLPVVLRKLGRAYGKLVSLRESALRTARELEAEIRRQGSETADDPRIASERRGRAKS